MTSNVAQAGSRRTARRPESSGNTNDAAGAALSRLQRAATTVRQHIERSVLRQENLTWTGFTVLRLVWTAQRLETRQAAAEAGIAKATLTGVTDALVARNLVRRLEHPQDRRLVLLELTGAGRRLVRRVLPAVQAEEAFAVAALDRGQVVQLGDLLYRLTEDLRADDARRRRA
jgi:DNA-binding MarR family transcriptional regulator